VLLNLGLSMGFTGTRSIPMVRAATFVNGKFNKELNKGSLIKDSFIFNKTVIRSFSSPSPGPS
jgi:hypothetical protein